MSRFLKLLLAGTLIVTLAGPAWPQPLPPPPPQAEAPALPPPIPPGVTPQWAPAPGNPRVLYAPNIPGNVFMFRGRYYYHHGGVWYRGKAAMGPWHPVRKIPRGLRRLHPSAFR